MAILPDRGEITDIADGDLFFTTDVSDTTDAATGTDKKNPWSNIKAKLKTYFDTLYSGPVTTIVGITGTKAEFDTACSDGNFLYVGDVTGISDGDKGDITVSGSGATWTIDNGAVTLAKQANMATASVVYRKTAGSGAPEVQTLATLKTDLGLTGTNSGDQTSIVGITGTKAQFDTAVTDGNFMYVGDAPTAHTHLLAAGATDVTATATELNVLDGIPATLTATELGYVDGVTSAIQTQLDSKLAASSYDDATAGETNTGTSTTKYLSPDGFAGSNFGIRYVQVALNGTTALTTSDAAYFRIPAALTGMNLVSVTGSVGTGAAGSSSSGTPTFTVKNVTDGNQMLSTSLTIDANEYTSATAAAAVAINGSFDDVVTDDLIEVAVTTAGTGVTYAVVTLGFQLP